jgi:hypothetical protein
MERLSHGGNAYCKIYSQIFFHRWLKGFPYTTRCMLKYVSL